MKKVLMLLFLVLTTFLFAREQKILKNHTSESFNPTSHLSREEIKEEVAEDAITHKELLDFVYNRYY